MQLCSRHTYFVLFIIFLQKSVKGLPEGLKKNSTRPNYAWSNANEFVENLGEFPVFFGMDLFFNRYVDNYRLYLICFELQQKITRFNSF